MSSLPALNYPPELPILTQRQAILDALATHNTLIVVAETGSGKSTQLPKICLEAGFGQTHKIACIQPRRIAAIAVASRIADEMKVPLGGIVGYRIRFDDKSSAATQIRLMTDGVLLAELHHSPNLNDYDCIIVDEAHERSLNIDLLLGLLLQLQRRRPALRIIISSATIDTEKFSLYFNNAPTITASGRMFPVEVVYQEPLDKEEEMLPQAIRALTTLLHHFPGGDVLVFLPSEDMIKEFLELASLILCKEKLELLPLFARLSMSEQQRIFQPSQHRKVIASTNIAETSLTLPDIRYVIDSGLVRISHYSASARIQNLPIMAASQAACNQRKGRCGRVAAGVCVRLFSEEDFDARQPTTEPEIKRANLAEAILRMLALGINHPETFPFLDQPEGRLFNEGFKTLHELGAINHTGKEKRKLSAMGRTMSQIPLDPRLARMLLAAVHEGCLEEIITLSAALSVMEMRLRPEDKAAMADAKHKLFQVAGSDLLWYIKLHQALHTSKSLNGAALRRFCKEHFLHFNRVKEWLALQAQITRLLQEKKFKSSSMLSKPWESTTKKGFAEGFTAFHKAALTGYLSYIATHKPAEMRYDKVKKKMVPTTRQSNLYAATKNQEMVLFPASSLLNAEWPWIFSTKAWRTSRLYAKEAAAIDSAWVVPLAQHLLTHKAQQPFYSTKKREVLCTQQTFLFSFLVETKSNVSYFSFDPLAARKLFITEALVNEEASADLVNVLPFLAHNWDLKAKLEQDQHKLRTHAIYVGDDAIVAFYEEHLPPIASLVLLKKALNDDPMLDTQLRLTRADLLLDPAALEALKYFPSTIVLDNEPLPVEYTFKPDSEEDGYSVILSPEQARNLKGEESEWGPMGSFAEKLSAMIKQLPRDERVKLHPTQTTIQIIINEIKHHGRLADRLSFFLKERLSIFINAEHWVNAEAKIDSRLRLRYVVKEAGNQAQLLSTRDKTQLAQVKLINTNQEAITHITKQWQRQGLINWPVDLAELPLALPINTADGRPAGMGYPTLYLNAETGSIDLTINPDHDDALNDHAQGVQALLLIVLKKELVALKKAHIFSPNLSGLPYLGGAKSMDKLFATYLDHTLFTKYTTIRTAEAFTSAISASSIKELWVQAAHAHAIITEALTTYATFRERLAKENLKNRHLHTYLTARQQELEELMGQASWHTLCTGEVEYLPYLLKCWAKRLEKGILNPAKEKEKAQGLHYYQERLKQLLNAPLNYGQQQKFKQARLAYKLLVAKTFAPELKGPPIKTQNVEELISSI
jgi:ATP-dependent helicase HrpA